MGLDSYFTFEGEKDTWPKVAIEANLCGGMFSGDDNGMSFRGKVYDDIIDKGSNSLLTLYEKSQDNSVVNKIADLLEFLLTKHPRKKVWGEYEIPRKELEDLSKVFRAYGNAGYGLYGWW